MHKQAIKVFFIILILQGCLYGITLEGQDTVNQIKQNALVYMFGEPHADCLDSETLVERFSSLEKSKRQKRAESADRQIRNVFLALAAISLCLNYLASCLIVRIIGRQPNNAI